jgi:hypothetical protein
LVEFQSEFQLICLTAERDASLPRKPPLQHIKTGTVGFQREWRSPISSLPFQRLDNHLNVLQIGQLERLKLVLEKIIIIEMGQLNERIHRLERKSTREAKSFAEEIQRMTGEGIETRLFNLMVTRLSVKEEKENRFTFVNGEKISTQQSSKSSCRSVNKIIYLIFLIFLLRDFDEKK